MYHKVFERTFVRFALIGALGFLVNYLLLYLLFDLNHIPIIAAQIVGAESALLATFVGNNYWAFRHHQHIPLKKKLLRYHLSSGTGILITTTFIIFLVRYAHLYYGIALTLAAGVGMFWNFIFNNKVIFTRNTAD